MEKPVQLPTENKAHGNLTQRQTTLRIPTILVFDSGVGGLSIAQELVQYLPHINIVYAADNREFPYGTKSEQELVARIDHILHAFQSACAADLIVVACNTASTIALPQVRERFKQPIVGVVPAIKPAALLSQTKIIGLLATPGTISRNYTDQLILEFAKGCTVAKCGSRHLVEFAEQKIQGCIDEPTNQCSGSQALPQPLIEELKPLVNAQTLGMDTVVLACTHFPLVKSDLQKLLPQVVHWVDSSNAIARRVEYLLQHDLNINLSVITENNNRPTYESLFSAEPKNLPKFLNYLADWFGKTYTVIDQ